MKVKVNIEINEKSFGAGECKDKHLPNVKKIYRIKLSVL